MVVFVVLVLIYLVFECFLNNNCKDFKRIDLLLLVFLVNDVKLCLNLIFKLLIKVKFLIFR